MSLENDDAAAAAVQKTPNRITLDHLKGLVATVQYFHPHVAPHVTICAMTTAQGWTVVGQSAPADPMNFDSDLGSKIAYDDALEKLWPLEGYLLHAAMAGPAVEHDYAQIAAALDRDIDKTQALGNHISLTGCVHTAVRGLLRWLETHEFPIAADPVNVVYSAAIELMVEAGCKPQVNEASIRKMCADVLSQHLREDVA